MATIKHVQYTIIHLSSADRTRSLEYLTKKTEAQLHADGRFHGIYNVLHPDYVRSLHCCLWITGWNLTCDHTLRQGPTTHVVSSRSMAAPTCGLFRRICLFDPFINCCMVVRLRMNAPASVHWSCVWHTFIAVLPNAGGNSDAAQTPSHRRRRVQMSASAARAPSIGSSGGPTNGV